MTIIFSSNVACKSYHEVCRRCQTLIVITYLVNKSDVSLAGSAFQTENTEGPCLTRILGLGKNRVT